MKKNYVLFILVLTISIFSWKPVKATHTHCYMDSITATGGSAGIDEYAADYCNVDTIILHKTAYAMTNFIWYDPNNIEYYTDSVFVTGSNSGKWTITADQIYNSTFIDIYVLTTIPTQPIEIHDTALCYNLYGAYSPGYIFYLIDVYFQQPGGPSYTCLWSDSTTGYVISYPSGIGWLGQGTHWLKLSNSCGSRQDTFTVSYLNPNKPNLGPDQSFCAGPNTVLNPNNTNISSYLWSTGATTSTLSVSTTGSYSVYTQEANGCDGYDTIQVTALTAPTKELCYVECDTTTGYNIIYWGTIIPVNVDSVRIYTETSLNVWTLVGVTNTLNPYFIDTLSNPNVQSYSYHITMIDSCGGESDTSTAHTTITLLSAYDSNTNTYGFTWSKYVGITVANYNLYGIDANGVNTLIGTVAGNLNFYNYINPSPNYIKYYVGFTAPSCNFKSSNIIKSNVVHSIITGIDATNNIPVQIFPNPVNDILNIQGIDEFNIQLINSIGQVIFNERNTKTIDTKQFSKGIYTVKLFNSKGCIYKKLVIE